ncbi:hypothetical protein ACJVC5_10100 [Peredibacter sp. HCB2-198]|uniref:hypothetical protein n=1 Tax=Peredibacter sp. HCB2-198 TaxID=3383025 RepID=UPI0038B5F08B
MKRFFSLLSLLLCFELIVSPVAPSLSLLGQEAHAESCPSGFTWDANLNRCLTATETANVMNATANCNGDVECYKQNAQQAFQKQVNEGKAPERKENNQFMSTVGGIAAIAGPVTFAAAGMASNMSTCTAASFWAMVGGSAALVAGDMLANFQHKKRLKAIKDDWGKIVNPEQAGGDKDKEREISIEAQSQSFEMLARAEDSLAKAAKMKKTFFLVATLAYAAAGVIAGIEIAAGAASGGLKTAAGDICKPSSPATGFNPPLKTEESLYAAYGKPTAELQIVNKQFLYNINESTDLASFVMNQKAIEVQLSSPSEDEYYAVKKAFAESGLNDDSFFSTFKSYTVSFVKNINPISNAYAETDSNAAKSYKEDDAKSSNILLTAGLGAGIGLAAGFALKGKKIIEKPLVSPISRAAFSGVMAIWTGIMASHAGKQAEASTKRAELLRKMKDDFASASGAIYACKSEDRNDPSKPNCYCYTAENQRNANRGNSQVCQKLWTGRDFTAGNYNNLASTSSKTCINSAGAADSACTCKTSKGGCMKVSLSSLKGVSPGTFSMLSQSLDPVNKIADGSVDAANINSANLENQAARMLDVNKKMENSKGLAASKKARDNARNDIVNKLKNASAGAPSGSLLGSSGSSQMPTNAGEAAAMLEKEVEDTEINKVGGNAGSLAAPESGSSNDPGLDFGLTADQAVAQENQLAEVMKQDLDYGQSDINQGSTTNIFEVLSNRYQRSGMRRLFDEKGVTQPEKAASTDISQ